MKAFERAWQLWPLLAHAATSRQLLTYEMVGNITGMAPVGFGPVLEHIQAYCQQSGLPPLTVIVVSKDSGLPGSGFIAATDLPRAMLNVFDHDWHHTKPPLPGALEAAHEHVKLQERTKG